MAKAAGHAAAAAFDQLGLRIGNESQHLEDWRDGSERLLVAVAMKQDGLAGPLQLDCETTGLDFPRDELFEQQRLLGNLDGLVSEAITSPRRAG